MERNKTIYGQRWFRYQQRKDHGGSDLTLSGGSLTNTGSMGMGEVLVNNGATLINDAHSELTGTKITVADGVNT